MGLWRSISKKEPLTAAKALLSRAMAEVGVRSGLWAKASRTLLCGMISKTQMYWLELKISLLASCTRLYTTPSAMVSIFHFALTSRVESFFSATLWFVAFAHETLQKVSNRQVASSSLFVISVGDLIIDRKSWEKISPLRRDFPPRHRRAGRPKLQTTSPCGGRCRF